MVWCDVVSSEGYRAPREAVTGVAQRKAAAQMEGRQTGGRAQSENEAAENRAKAKKKKGGVAG